MPPQQKLCLSCQQPQFGEESNLQSTVSSAQISQRCFTRPRYAPKQTHCEAGSPYPCRAGWTCHWWSSPGIFRRLPLFGALYLLHLGSTGKEGWSSISFHLISSLHCAWVFTCVYYIFLHHRFWSTCSSTDKIIQDLEWSKDVQGCPRPALYPVRQWRFFGSPRITLRSHQGALSCIWWHSPQNRPGVSAWSDDGWSRISTFDFGQVWKTLKNIEKLYPTSSHHQYQAPPLPGVYQAFCAVSILGHLKLWVPHLWRMGWCQGPSNSDFPAYPYAGNHGLVSDSQWCSLRCTNPLCPFIISPFGLRKAANWRSFHWKHRADTTVLRFISSRTSGVSHWTSGVSISFGWLQEERGSHFVTTSSVTWRKNGTQPLRHIQKQLESGKVLQTRRCANKFLSSTNRYRSIFPFLVKSTEDSLIWHHTTNSFCTRLEKVPKVLCAYDAMQCNMPRDEEKVHPVLARHVSAARGVCCNKDLSNILWRECASHEKMEATSKQKRNWRLASLSIWSQRENGRSSQRSRCL